MKQPTRRHFLEKLTFASLGVVAATNGIGMRDALAASYPQLIDAKLAGVLDSYGRTGPVQEGGFRQHRLGAHTRQLPVARLQVEVRDYDSFCQSFAKLSKLSNRIMVKGNTTRFAHNGRYLVIENLVT